MNGSKAVEEILYECYVELEWVSVKKAPKMVPYNEDVKLFNGMTRQLSRLLSFFESTDDYSSEEVYRHLVVAKQAYAQYILILNRRPELITDRVVSKMDRLLSVLSICEAQQLELFMSHLADRDSVDIFQMFRDDGNRLLLKTKTAMSIVAEALGLHYVKMNQKAGSAYYRTNTGRRYHVLNCPYCQGKEIYKLDFDLTQEQGLTPCVCITQGVKKRTICSKKLYSTHITAFVDESLRKTEWDSEGKRGHVGNYSYVICKGEVASSRIRYSFPQKLIICEGVDYYTESEHVEMLTEEAIGKVLIRLLYDYGFKRNVIIYTDNMSTVTNWDKKYKNGELAKQFESVSVKYIPRRYNKYADEIGRKRMVLDIPMNTYMSIVNKIKEMEELEDKDERYILL